jgi:endo-1,3(4)-beta-glucanase
VYDSNLGGLVTIDGLLNPQADFGNGRYNDHHFHYGYILYACAILGKLDPSFVDQYHQEVDAINYDVAHDSNYASQATDGVFFPAARHKVWFDGHSFANGLFPFGNGKSQESSSEAVNCYYGAYLWSLVRHGAASDPDADTSAQTDFARLLLATEIRGARTYWHMVPPNSSSKGTSTTVYSPEFSKNYMVGNLGMLDAISSTWFGTASLYVHMINLIPVTAVTGELFDQNYVTEEYSNVLEPLHEVEMAWRGFVIADHAIIDAQSAWEEAQGLISPQLDSGLSKSQVLYFIATRSGFKVTNTTSVLPASDDASEGPKESPQGGGGGGKRTCSTHPICENAGLVGDCCPTMSGVHLSCCDGR